MDELRWFLLILGIVVIAAIYGYGRLQEWRQEGPPWRRRRESREPFADEPLSDDDIEGALSELDDLISERRTAVRGNAPGSSRTEPREPPRATSERHPEPHLEPDAAPEPELEPEPERAPAVSAEPAVGEEGTAEGPAWPSWRERLHRLRPAPDERTAPEAGGAAGPGAGEEKIVVINVAAPEGGRFHGPALVVALKDTGMRHGEHQIFHRVLETRDGTVSLYSAANILKPGWFDLDDIDTFETPGIAFFLRLPGPFDGLAAFEQMLGTAREIADRLGGHLLDSRRCDLTQQAVEHIREDLLEYRRRAHLAARQAR